MIEDNVNWRTENGIPWLVHNVCVCIVDFSWLTTRQPKSTVCLDLLMNSLHFCFPRLMNRCHWQEYPRVEAPCQRLFAGILNIFIQADLLVRLVHVKMFDLSFLGQFYKRFL